LEEWVCLKCDYKWKSDEPIEPRECPKCGAQTIYVPKEPKIKYVMKGAPKP